VSEQKEKSLKGLDEEPSPKSSDVNGNVVTWLAIDRVPGNPLSSRQSTSTNGAKEPREAFPPFLQVVVPYYYSHRAERQNLLMQDIHSAFFHTCQSRG